jgi:hypothetical protein
MAAIALALTACAPSSGPSASASAVANPQTVYDLANGCFLIKVGDSYVTSSGAGFALAGSNPAGAEHFYMQATGLGRYLFYTSGGKILTGDGTAVTAAAAPVDGSDWTFAPAGAGPYMAATGGKSLAVDGTGKFIQGASAAPLAFESASGCAAYPEMPIDIGDTFHGRGVGQPVIGFAEVHSHMGMGSEMSDGSKHVGPSAGGAMYGQAMNRFGAPEALKDCKGTHGPQGIASGENIVLDQNPTEHHDTVGWPTFVGWPQADSQLHQQMYWRWVERAYHAGLRLMTIHGTNIEALCDVAKKSGGNKDTQPMDEDCTDMGVGVKQVEYLYDIQNYVDAQNHGPGKGWFRIVKDPAEARAVINEGKMAVVPGLEFSNIFGCSVTFAPDGSETAGCSKEKIDSEIERVWNLGVRQLIPFHDVDSALGGTGIFSFALNAIGFYGTHQFWKTYDCPGGGEGDTYFYDAGTYMYGSKGPPGFGNDPLTQALIANAQGVLPLYPADKRQCNARGLTELGRYALEKIMQKGFVLDVDHAELSIKQDMLDLGAATTPNYPMLSAHGGHGGITMAQAQQILNQGGLIYPALPNGEDYVAFMKKVKAIWPASHGPLAVGYGADSNGLRNLPGPRSAGATKVTYPFELFAGPGWGPQFAAAGIGPIKVDLLDIPDSTAMPPVVGQSWNIDEVGVAHYGLVADFVEQVRIEGGQEATDALYNSAEAYLQMWEQTRAAAAK